MIVSASPDIIGSNKDRDHGSHRNGNRVCAISRKRKWFTGLVASRVNPYSKRTPRLNKLERFLDDESGTDVAMPDSELRIYL